MCSRDTLELEAKPPHPPRVDRVDDFINDLPRNGANFKEPAIRSRLARLLGEHRFRDPDEEADL